MLEDITACMYLARKIYQVYVKKANTFRKVPQQIIF